MAQNAGSSLHSTEQGVGPLDADEVPSDQIRKQFNVMYYILHELKEKKNLLPAIEWSRENREALEARGSNLEFELCRLQFVWLYHGNDDQQGDHVRDWKTALEYARQEFQSFMPRYLREVQQLMGAMAFCPNLQGSPYSGIFNNQSAWDDMAQSFTREFCSLLGLSADSPLYIAATAGAIALPTLLKLQTIMKAKRTEWTSENELPVGRLSSLFANLVTDLSLGRNIVTTLLPLPFDLRLPRLQGASDRSEPSDDDAVWTCYRPGIAAASQQGQSVQVPVLPQRKPSKGRPQGVPVMARSVLISSFSGDVMLRVIRGMG